MTARTVRSLAALALVACAGPVAAQNPFLPPNNPFLPQPVVPRPQQPPRPVQVQPNVFLQPQVPNRGGVQLPNLNFPFQHGNQFNSPYGPYASAVPVLFNQIVIPNQNPFAPSLVINNPFAPNNFNQPPIGFGPNPNFFGGGFSGGYSIQQPGAFQFRGPNRFVNPFSGTAYAPFSGVAQTADGSLFYRVPGTGAANQFGNYAVGSGLYYNAESGAFLNPASGIIARPGNFFLPYIY